MATDDRITSPLTAEETITVFEGFDIEIQDHHADRIDRLVNEYEAGILNQVETEYLNATKWSDRLADNIAAFGGSWGFIMLFAVALITWILWNTAGALSLRFDPAPFILLNLCLSFIAAFQAPVIMMSQNRQAARDKREAIINFAINYKAEQEIDDMQAHLHRIEAKLASVEDLLKVVAGKGPQLS